MAEKEEFEKSIPEPVSTARSSGTSRTAARRPTAYVAIHLSDDEGPSDEEAPIAMTAIRPTVSGYAKLPKVNIWEDPRVFALLDEGCNRTCHG